MISPKDQLQINQVEKAMTSFIMVTLFLDIYEICILWDSFALFIFIMLDWNADDGGQSNASPNSDQAEQGSSGVDFSMEGQRKDINTISLKLRFEDSTGSQVLWVVESRINIMTILNL